MKKGKIILISIMSIIMIAMTIIFFILFTNKTFFKTTYLDVRNKKIFIPKYSYFKSECCMTAANFYSLRSEKELKKEIANYMSDFQYYSNDTTYGYKKGDLTIQSYEVIDNGFYRTITIIY